jgi:hypothetical protein
VDPSTWGSRGRRFKSRQPDRTGSALALGSRPVWGGSFTVLETATPSRARNEVEEWWGDHWRRLVGTPIPASLPARRRRRSVAPTSLGLCARVVPLASKSDVLFERGRTSTEGVVPVVRRA